MDKQLNVKDIQKEVDLIIDGLKAKHGMVDFLAKGRKVKKHLLEIRKALLEYLKEGNHNLNVLQKDSTGKLQKTKQIASNEIDKTKKLLNEIDSALDYYQHTAQKAVSPTKTNYHIGAKRNIEFVSTSKVTSQTIALLDAERYGTTTDHGVFIEYPKPHLGSPTNQRNCSIADKIRMGFENSG